MRILVVDDDYQVNRALVRTVGGLGIEVESCARAADAIARFKVTRFDLALLDAEIDGDDGIRLAETLRIIDPLLPLVFVSSAWHLRNQALSLEGLVHFVEKPWVNSELRWAVRSFLKGSPVDPAMASQRVF